MSGAGRSDDDVAFDFAFVDAAQPRARDRPVDDVQFDFRFADADGRLRRSSPSAEDGGWDFSFVDGATDLARDSGGGQRGQRRPPASDLDPTPLLLDRWSTDPLKILTICTHNRTRSVMTMALLQDGFDRLVGDGAVIVRSLGFGPEGEAAIADAVDSMGRRGIDISHHRSRQVTEARVRPADLVLTAEREHVVRIAALAPDVFDRSFTLPEFCGRVARDPSAGPRPVREWLESLSAGRSSEVYLTDGVDEIADPTGSPRRQFEAAVHSIQQMCATVVEIVSRSL